MAQIPAAPGTTPIPDNYVRLYHYTGAEPEQIAREGLRMQYAKGENYGEPNQIWASARFPEGSAIYNPVVEFAVPVGDPRWNIGKMESGIRYNPDATGTGKEWNPEEHVQHYKKYLEDHGSHVTFGGDIDPSEILAIHESWHPHYRYYQENGIDPNEHQWMHETMPNSPEARAMKEYEKTLGQWRRQTYYPPQGGGDPRPDWIPSEHHDQLVEPMTATPLGPCEKCGDGMQRDAEGVYCPSCGNRTNADVQNSRIYEYAPLGEGIGEGPFGLMSKQAAEPIESDRLQLMEGTKVAKLAMPLHPDQLQQHIEKHGPYAYHETGMTNIDPILNEGIRSDEEFAEEGLGGTQRPGHSYLWLPTRGEQDHKIWPLRVDLRKLDPNRLVNDEDAAEWIYPDFPIEKMRGRGDLGEWIMQQPDFDSPERVEQGMRGGTVAYQGDIPAEAIERNPLWWQDPKNVKQYEEVTKNHHEWKQQLQNVQDEYQQLQDWLNNGGIVGTEGEYGWSEDGRIWAHLKDGGWMQVRQYPPEIEDKMREQGVESEFVQEMKKHYPEQFKELTSTTSALDTEPYPGMPTERPDLPPGVLHVTNPYEDRIDNDFVFDRTPALHFPETGTLAVGERGQTHGDLRRNIGVQGYQLPGYGWEHELWGAQPAYDTPEMWKATEYAEGDANGLPVPGGWSHRDAFPLMKQVKDVPIYKGLNVVGAWRASADLSFDNVWRYRVPFFVTPNGEYEMGVPGDEHYDIPERRWIRQQAPGSREGDLQGHVIFHPEYGEIPIWPEWLTDDQKKQQILDHARATYDAYQSDPEWELPPRTATWKLARTTMFHVAPSNRREQIKEHGLLSSPKPESPWLFGSPPGTYLWDTPRNAHLYGGNSQPLTDPDIWAVDVTGLNLQEDPFFEPKTPEERGKLLDPTDKREQYRGPHGIPGAFVTQDNIPPERLHLAYPNPWKPEPGIKDYWNEETESFERPTMLNVSATNVTVEEMPVEMLSGYQGVGFRGRPIRLAIREPDVNSTHPYFKDNNLAAFADVFDEGNNQVSIGFINTAPEMQGRGLARQLVQAIYDQFPNAKIRWGKLMDDAMVHLKDQFKQQFPDRTAEWKLARTTLYHVTNQANRDSIRENGLDPTLSETWHGTKYPYLWFHDNYQQALDYAASGFFPQDIWIVDGSGLHLQTDPHGPYKGAFASQDRIPPDRLIDVKPYEGGGDRDRLIEQWYGPPAEPKLIPFRQKEYSSWKFSITGIPAQYSEDDPLDLQGKQPVFDNMQVDWWNLPEEEQRHAVVNAFRATMLSPRLRLRDNAIMYQEMMAIPAEESDPDVFEQHARSVKEKWDRQGQGDLMGDVEPMGWEQQVPGKLTPGFWTNIRRLAALGPYSEKLRQAALADIQENGGKGNFFRDEVLRLGIPGVGPKVASFAWLALNPKGSDLGTLDVWMMRHLNQDVESPNNPSHYFDLENQLRDEKDALYGPETPLGQYQWGVWDKIRTPGLHQDHSPLRVYDPTPYNQVAWGDFARGPRPPIVQPQIPGQEQLFSKRSSAIVNAMWEENEEYGLLYRAPEEQLAHDYHPSWDQIEDENINPEAAESVKKICERIYSETQMPFEVWAVQLPKEAVAMYINGTSGYPVILLDLAKHVGYEDQYWQSIVHELRHAEQEANSEGDANFDEEEAENSERMPFSAY